MLRRSTKVSLVLDIRPVVLQIVHKHFEKIRWMFCLEVSVVKEVLKVL